QEFQGSVTFVKAPQASEENESSGIEATVKSIIADVRRRGDEAVRHYSKAFDGVDLAELEISKAETARAIADLDKEAREGLDFAIDRVRAFAKAQRATLLPLDVEISPGVHLGHRIIPIARAGAYVPGGRYPLLSA